MKCYRCGNEDPLYFYLDNHTYYCRKCVGFKRLNANEEIKVKPVIKRKINAQYYLPYTLSKKQQMAAKQILDYLIHKKDVFVYAACGAGKTELSMEAIKYYLQKGLKVGFAISRRQVVIELTQRFKQAFPMIKVVCVCEGYLNDLDGDLIVCTMHQLYRYHGWFDLLIMDEVDAFPYRGNELLKTIAYNACVGQKLMLSATPDDEIKTLIKNNQIALVTLFERPHGYPLIEPKVITLIPIMQYLYMIYYIEKHKKLKIPLLIFVPTIKLGKKLYYLLKLKYRCCLFTSQSENKDQILQAFQNHQYEFIIATTVLERGITILGINIMVIQADHNVFNEASLIQIIGRVGRKKEMPFGEGVFLCKKKTDDIKNCCLAIQKMNNEA